MKITPVKEIGSNRLLCVTKIRVAKGLATNAAKYGAFERERKKIPIDQCGHRSDFLVDGAPTCRAHAGAAALAHLLGDKN